MNENTSTPAPIPNEPVPPMASPAPPRGNLAVKPRIWPPLILVALLWSAIWCARWYFPQQMMQFVAMFLGPMVAGLLFTVWWLFFSRVPRAQRWIMLGFTALLVVAVYFLSHLTIGGFGIVLYGLPTAMTTLVLWLLISSPLPWRFRYIGLFLGQLTAWAFLTLVRMDGVYSQDFSAVLHWRWDMTAEELFQADLAAGKISRAASSSSDKSIKLQPGDWPGFRGANRDSKLEGVRIATDWETNPPKLLWRHRVGPGWSSFAVVGNLLFTQEQNGDVEQVVCYDSGTGNYLWTFASPGRFTENVSGPGPRATPTFDEGKIYTLGAVGQLSCLDALTGTKLWSKDIKADSGAKNPIWGFSSSPLIVHGLVIVFAGGEEGKAVLAYKADTGELAWTNGGKDQLSYCSPQLVKIDGIEQVVLTSNTGLQAFEPKTGNLLWQFPWSSDNVVRIVQPAVVEKTDLLLGTGLGIGTKRVHVGRDEEGTWKSSETWMSKAIKPYFTDLVIHKGHIYGFDTVYLTCVDLKNGKSKWRSRGDANGRDSYGNAQTLLLADQDLLLILTEKGEAVLVEAGPADHKELARFQALERKDCRTWNHPVIAHGRLYVRNEMEAACYELKAAE